MKCPNCGAEWQLPPTVKVQLNKCPFCGSSLTSMLPSSLETISDVLIAICDRFGIESLREGAKTVAIFSDLAPHLKKERVLLSYLIQLNGHTKLLSMIGQDRATQMASFKGVVKSLTDDLFVAESAAESVCKAFTSAIGISIVVETPRPTSTAQSNGASTREVSQGAVTHQSARTSGTVAKTASSMYRTTSNTSPPTRTTTNSKLIQNYSQYLKALENYYISHGKVRLTNQQVREFIALNRLDVEWKITAQEVEKDLSTIYSRYPSPKSSYTPVSTVAAAPAPFKKMPTRIGTYNVYMDALETLFLQNGKKKLSTVQIRDFISRYSLSANFGVTVADVEKDILTIARKYI